jgi:hypothetical protein
MARLAFKKTTPDGLAVDVEEVEGLQLLLVTKTLPGSTARAVQILGVAGQEINTPTLTWYYEYEPLPKTVSVSRLAKSLESRGYTVGTFDQFGNFRMKAA